MNTICSISRHIFCFSLLCGVSACGFTPMYGASDKAEQNSVAASLAQVEIATIPDRSGQVLRNDLLDRFYTQGYPSAPLYKLSVDTLTELRVDLDITKSSEATRSQLRLTSKMTLYDNKGVVLATRDLFAIASFNVLQSEFATRVTEENARQNAIHDLARQIELNVVLVLKQK